MSGPGSSRRELLAALGAYAVLSVAATWPLAADFGTRLAGGEEGIYGDNFQTLWGFWWLRHALLTGESPFFTDLLHHPAGISLVHQSFDLPAALLVLPLWGLVPAVALLNGVLLLSFVLAGFFAFLLARELGASSAAAFLGGCLFTFGPFHAAHAMGHLHVAQIDWVPLYGLLLLRAGRSGSLKGAALAGLAAAAAGAASFYQLLFCLLLTPFLLGLVLREPGAWARLRSLPGLRLAAAVAAPVLLLIGPLLLAVVAAGRAEPWSGEHDPVQYSADLQSLLLPVDVLRTSALWSRPAWTGNSAENAGTLGFVALALALLAAGRRPAARWLLAAAGLGAAASLGPALHWGGVVVHDGPMPYSLLAALLPFLELSGVPVRLGFLATFGLSLAAALGLDELVARLQGQGLRAARPLAIAAGVLALLELWPRPLPTSAHPVPKLFHEWAADPAPWAVLDASGWVRPLWNGLHHQHPQLGGYTTRRPERLQRFLEQPALLPFFEPDAGATGPAAPAAGDPPGAPQRRLHASGLEREELRAALSGLGVRYVLVKAGDQHRAFPAEVEAELPRIHDGDGLWIYELPPR